VDIGVVSFLIFFGITWFRRTQARLALIGLSILGGVYLAARILGLEVTAWILQGFFAASVIVVIVVFQDEIRRFFEQIAVWGMRRRRAAPPPDFVEVIARAAVRLAEGKRGALLVFPGSEPIERHIEGGIRLDARLSEPLLLSLFDPHSPGHDGAVIIDGDRVRSFAVRLPLSANQSELGTRGTRHAAALGLSERADALILVVSEERGTITLASGGTLRQLDRHADLAAPLRRFLVETARESASPRSAWRRMGARWLEIAFSVFVALLLWVVVATGSTTIEVTRHISVVPVGVPAGYSIESVEPPAVDVTFSGRRRHLFPALAESIEIRVDVSAVRGGEKTFAITRDLVPRPENVDVVEISPNRVRLTARRAP
jgi:uncharacterized protein (TIGR00159 family)